MAEENADPTVQTQEEEGPQVILDAPEHWIIQLPVGRPMSFGNYWSSDAFQNAISCHKKVVLQYRSDGEDVKGLQLGSDDKTVCQDSGDKLTLDCPKLSAFGIPMNSDKQLEQLRISNNEFALKLLHLLQKRGQDYSPSLQTETDLRKKLNILSPENEVLDKVPDIAEMTLQKLDYSTECNLNSHKKTMPKDPMFQPHGDTLNQQKHKETAQHVSASVLFAIACMIWFLLETRSHKSWVPTLIHVQPLHKENGLVSIGVPLLGLFGFMAFVWAVAMMILAGAQFTRLHSAVFILWAILMHVRPSSFQYLEFFS